MKEHKHNWVVVRWKYIYPGVSALRPDYLVAVTFMCSLCGEKKEEGEVNAF